MARPTPLWSDRPGDDEHPWLAAEPVPLRPAQDPGPTEPPQRGWRDRMPGRRALAVLGAFGALIGAGAIGATIADTGDGNAKDGKVITATLPAVGGAAAPATEIGKIYAAASSGVVSVQVRTASGGGSGTGFVIDTDGTIVTNAHVVDGATSVRVRFDDKGQGVTARVLGSDASSDLAVLKVEPAGLTLKPLALADSDDVKVGDAAIAIGYPLGLDRTATAGIVSGVGRKIEAPNGFSIDEVIQTDAPINPGNSGGPLLDARGRVIGVNSQIATAGGSNGSVGIGFAVPSNTVREVIPALEQGQSIERPYLGVSTSPDPGGNGAVIGEITSGGPAQQAGLSVGDVVVGIDDKTVTSPEDVAAAIKDRKPGDKVTVNVRRSGSPTSVQVTLGTRPGSVP
jgi:putative serine protease PepD